MTSRPRRECSLSFCHNVYVASGYCRHHYTGWHRHGDPLWNEPTNRFWRFVNTSTGCWQWIGPVGGAGYGDFSIKGRSIGAHRFSYELNVGPIPPGLHLDHLCRNTLCVKPSHLEPVTSRVNTLRGVGIPAINAAKSHCKQGHPFTPENTYRYWKGRHCRECNRLAMQRLRSRRKALRNGEP